MLYYHYYYRATCLVKATSTEEADTGKRIFRSTSPKLPANDPVLPTRMLDLHVYSQYTIILYIYILCIMYVCENHEEGRVVIVITQTPSRLRLARAYQIMLECFVSLIEQYNMGTIFCHCHRLTRSLYIRRVYLGTLLLYYTAAASNNNAKDAHNHSF